MKIILALTMIFLSACTSLQSVSTSSIPSQRNKKITAKNDKFVFLGFNFNNEYVDSVVKDLAKQCPNGRVEGILTKQETINYFLFIFWKSNVTASGYCVGKNVAQNGKARIPSDVDSTETAEGSVE